MAALHDLSTEEQAFIRIERGTCLELLDVYRHHQRRLEGQGSVSVAYLEKLQQQIDAVKRHIERYDGMLR